MNICTFAVRLTKLHGGPPEIGCKICLGRRCVTLIHTDFKQLVNQDTKYTKMFDVFQFVLFYNLLPVAPCDKMWLKTKNSLELVPWIQINSYTVKISLGCV